MLSSPCATVRPASCGARKRRSLTCAASPALAERAEPEEVMTLLRDYRELIGI
jgi:hypothetical protein